MPHRNRRWTNEEFFAERQKVLSRWPTGAEIVDLDEAIEYQKRLPPHKVYAYKLARARELGQIMVVLRLGKPRIEEVLSELGALAEYSDFLELDVDTYTRKGLYARAQEALERTYGTGENLLNAYPYVAYGARKTRRLTEASRMPLFISSNDEDTRLIDEIGMAAGLTGNIAHDVREVISHSKNYPLDQRIRNNQYCCRLAAHYTEHGAPITVMLGGSNVTFSPPSMGTSLVVMEALTAAEQGVKFMLPCHDQKGGLVQDVAAYHTMTKIVRKYLDRFGYKDITMYMRAGSGGYAWPRDRDASACQVALCTVTAVLAGCDLVRTKSTDEGLGVPSVESQISAGKAARHVINVLGKSRLEDSDELRIEESMQEREVKAIVDKVLELGDGDLAQGEIKAVAQGVIDVPFSPWLGVKGWAFPVRDKTGAVRYHDPGNIPLPKDVIQYHREKIADREQAEKRKAGVEMLIEDLAVRTKPVTAGLRM